MNAGRNKFISQKIITVHYNKQTLHNTHIEIYPQTNHAFFDTFLIEISNEYRHHTITIH